jgi:hypothetical protein
LRGVPAEGEQGGLSRLRTRVLPRWLGVTGLAVSALYLLNQGDILATAVPGFPVWDLAGPIGSTGWGAWVAALGVTILLRPASRDPPAPGNRDPAGHGRAQKLSTASPRGHHPNRMPLTLARLCLASGPTTDGSTP